LGTERGKRGGACVAREKRGEHEKILRAGGRKKGVVTLAKIAKVPLSEKKKKATSLSAEKERPGFGANERRKKKSCLSMSPGGKRKE